MLFPASSALGSESFAITNTQPNSYVWDKLAVDAPVYIDSKLTLTDIPEPYVGLDYLRTSKSDNRSTSNPFISFAVNESVSVYVAMDSRSRIPSWLQDWSDTGDQLVARTRRSSVKYELYHKDFPVGDITLGGNEGGRRSNMYFVVVKSMADGGSQPDGGTPVPDPVPVPDPAPVPVSELNCPCSVWSNSDTPTNPSEADQGAVELGVKFTVDRDGFITGLRFYKGTGNTGTHIGNVWTLDGTRLATATFTGESATGWQQVDFTPVAVTAGTVYVASYFAPNGYYADDTGYFATTGVDNGPLHLLQDGVSGHNGVFAYVTSSGFPNLSWRTSNYWVDVVFTDNFGPDTTAPTVTGITPTDGASDVGAGAVVTATFNEAMDTATLTSQTFELLDAGNRLVPASVSYNAGSRTATLTPSVPLDPSTTYTATLKGGATDTRVRDLAGNALAADFAWSFTTNTGAVSDPASSPVPAPAPVPTVSLTSTASTVTDNDSTTLNWTASNADSCTASGGWFGSKETSGTESTVPLTQDTTFTLDCTGPGGSASQSIIVKVLSPSGVATLSWTPPTTKQDGSSLTNLAGYKVYYGISPDGTPPVSYSSTIVITNPGISSYMIENLLPGTYYFVVTAFDSSGLESSNSNVASTTIYQ